MYKLSKKAISLVALATLMFTLLSSVLVSALNIKPLAQTEIETLALFECEPGKESINTTSDKYSYDKSIPLGSFYSTEYTNPNNNVEGNNAVMKHLASASWWWANMQLTSSQTKDQYIEFDFYIDNQTEWDLNGNNRLSVVFISDPYPAGKDQWSAYSMKLPSDLQEGWNKIKIDLTTAKDTKGNLLTTNFDTTKFKSMMFTFNAHAGKGNNASDYARKTGGDVTAAQTHLLIGVDNVRATKIIEETIPVFSGTEITLKNSSKNSLTINWPKATDDDTDEGELEYTVYIAYQKITQETISSASIVFTGKNVTEAEATGLEAGTGYYFAVSVKDKNQNTATLFSDKIMTEPETSEPGQDVLIFSCDENKSNEKYGRFTVVSIITKTMIPPTTLH